MVTAGDATLPDPALVVLIGAAGSGKSTWAAARYRPVEIVSADQLRGVVGSGEHDLAASADAFSLLDQIVAARLGRGLTTVVDTLGLDPGRRRAHRELARRAGLPAVVVLLDTSPARCRDRNRARERPVPASVLDGQLRRMAAVRGQVEAEGWDAVLAGSDQTVVEPAHSPGAGQARDDQQQRPARMGFILQISRFPWDEGAGGAAAGLGGPAARVGGAAAGVGGAAGGAGAGLGGPAGWLAGVASAAVEAGFEGIALMDHLIQIPQAGRAWEPIPEPWVTLGLLAGLTAGTGLRLGTLVTPVTFRAPGLLAKTVATLDVLSGGRAFCGLGAGWWEREHAGFGLPFPSAPSRLDLLETAIETMRALWRPGTRAYQGDRVSLPETTCYPRPAGPVPIIVGGSGERRTLRIAARLGDGCNLPSDLAVLDRKLAVLRAHCAEAGRDPAEVAVTVLDIPVVGQDREDAAAIVERLRGRTAAAAFARRHHAGPVADHVGRYRLLADRGVSTVFVSLPDLAGPQDVLRLAPVVQAFAGGH
jgi:alkanesulfonate monooxygenase SsuD/methylene tetrahydromethanopterin reductase-like flavin-dependent oxidoreductase (luciferase family)/predicted kinase